MQAGLYMIVFFVMRILRVSGFFYFGTLFYNLMTVFTFLPCLCGILMFYTFGQITRKFLAPRGSQKAIKCCNIAVDFPKLIKNALTILVFAVIIVSLVFTVLGNYFKNFDYILNIYINTLTLGIFAILTVFFVAFYTYRLVQVLKKSNKLVGENSRQEQMMLASIKVMIFYIYMVFGYLIGLLSMFYVCTVSTANDETAVNFDVKVLGKSYF